MSASILTFGLVAALAAPAPEPPMKCSPAATISADGRRMVVPEPGVEVDPVVVVDDAVVDESEKKDELDPRDLESVQVACWDPESGRFRSGLGLTVVLIVTNTGWEGRPETEEALRAAQARVLTEWYQGLPRSPSEGKSAGLAPA